jgi:LysM repeat protein
VQSGSSFTPDTSNPSTVYATTYTLSPSGILKSAYIADGRPRTDTYINGMDGHVIRRDEADNISTQGDPHSIYYYFNGVEMASTGNVMPNSSYSYDDSITERAQTPPSSSSYVFPYQFYGQGDLSYDRVNTFGQGSAGGSYTVQSGDTLQSIALAVWGDSSLWYKIADANGLTDGASLFAGQSLTLPAGVTRLHNNASTYTPYDPSQAVGNISPTAPKPQKKSSNKCGVFGQLLHPAMEWPRGQRSRRIRSISQRPPTSAAPVTQVDSEGPPSLRDLARFRENLAIDAVFFQL